jgi:16S rRNA (uracil1498-N3)-methyltransferase
VNLFYQPLLLDGTLHLDEEESRHCVKVLRKRSGDEIRITDGAGSFYTAIIESADPKRCTFVIKDKSAEAPKHFSIHIAIAPTKNADRIEWFVEKATEFGVDEITLLDTEHTERSFIKTERLVKVAVSAMKQSLKSSLPKLNGLVTIDKVIGDSKADQRFIAYVDESNPNHLLHAALQRKNYLVLVGPEGDFSKDELTLAVENGFSKISLGRSRLRTETAGLAACHILNLVNTAG